MSCPINGGPAFPFTKEMQSISGLQFSTGMTLRDWFAGQCDPSIYKPVETFRLAAGHEPNSEELAEWVAAIRYMEADAILRIQKKGAEV